MNPVTLNSLGTTPDEEALQRRQALLREIQLKRLQDRDAIPASTGEATSAEPARDQLTLSKASQTEQHASQELEAQKNQAEALFLNLNAALAAFN